MSFQDGELHRTDTRCASVGVKDLGVEPHMICKKVCRKSVKAFIH